MADKVYRASTTAPVNIAVVKYGMPPSPNHPARAYTPGADMALIETR